MIWPDLLTIRPMRLDTLIQSASLMKECSSTVGREADPSHLVLNSQRQGSYGTEC